MISSVTGLSFGESTGFTDTCRPIGLRGARLLANASLTISTRGLPMMSRASKARPATIGNSSVEKYVELTI